MTRKAIPSALWSAQDPAETAALYDRWAEDYDADMAASGYVGADRAAEMLRRVGATGSVLDFGCGTGLSGVALRERGFRTVDGTDLSAQMIDRARDRGIYRSLTVARAGHVSAPAADIEAILAAGVIRPGAGPAHLPAELLRALPPGGWLVMTYNDTTLADAAFMRALADLQVEGLARLELAEYGPQLPAEGYGCTVYALRRL